MTDERIERRMTREDCAEVGFKPYYELLECFDVLIDDDGRECLRVWDWDDDRILAEFKVRGYIEVDLPRTEDTDPANELMQYMLETGMQVETPWSSAAGVEWNKMWFRNEVDAVKARLIVAA